MERKTEQGSLIPPNHTLVRAYYLFTQRYNLHYAVFSQTATLLLERKSPGKERLIIPGRETRL